MDALVTIGSLQLDAAHIFLLVAGLALAAGLIWLRARWRESSLAVETQAFERGREIERLQTDLESATASADMLRGKYQEAEKQLAALTARGEAERRGDALSRGRGGRRDADPA
ncbi:MAG: hypothetical protein AAF638_14210, partial [Pseudomonadota bacterium]